MGKPMVTLPLVGKSTGRKSAIVEITIKKINTGHIFGNEGKEGIKYIKRAIADAVVTPI